MEIKSYTYLDSFELAANAYLIVDEYKHCVLVDPGKEDSKIVDFIKENGLTLVAILLTHGHFDHIRGVDYFASEFNCPVFIHKNDIEYLTNPHLNCSDRFSRKDVVIKAKPIIINGEFLDLLDKPIKVIGTPFHTMGSVCYYLASEKALFSGDTLFLESVGRTDFPGSNPNLIPSSLAKLMELDNDIKVYPGHGEQTSIGYERMQNPFVKR